MTREEQIKEASSMFEDYVLEGVFTMGAKWADKNQFGIVENPGKEALNHPCRDTYSGWEQGYAHGYNEAIAMIKLKEELR